tara:strand:- start:39 stop:1190 length:1152 start_codon:yes stop_codon:yes gene_type:complete
MLGARKLAVSGGNKFRDEHSLVFDGTSDYIQTGVKPVDTADATYVFWVKSSETGENKSLFNHGGDRIGGFTINHGTSNKPLLYLNAELYQYWADTPAQDDGQWHHWAVVVDINDMTACKLYVDGVEQTQGARSTTDSITSYENFRIARGSSEYWAGSMSEFAIYDVMLSASQVRTLYNGRDPYNHKEGILTGNLKAWWRMGDGTLDTTKHFTSPVIEGGVLSDESQISYLGPDLVDDAMNASNWTVWGNNTVELDSGAIKITYVDNSSGAYFYLRNTDGMTEDITIGKVYKVSYQAKVNTGSIFTAISESDGFGATGNTTTSTSYVNYAIYIVGTATGDHYFYAGGMDAGEIMYYRNIKVQEVVGNTGVVVNMASAQFSGDAP